jgi:hypothetical protein
MGNQMAIETIFEQQQTGVSNSAPQALKEAFDKGAEDFVRFVEGLPEKKQQQLLELCQSSAN